MAKPEQVGPPRYNGEVEFTLRDFRVEDFERLWNIDQCCFAPGIAYSRRELAVYIRRRGSFTIVAEALPQAAPSLAGEAEAEIHPYGSIVGFIVAEANHRGLGHIISIDVLPASRRFGLGSRLLRAAEDRLQATSCHAVVLETAVDNAAALAFYKRHHYSIVKIVPRYYSNGVDAFVLEKNLLQSDLPTKRTGLQE